MARQIVIAADGRDSRLRTSAGLEVQNLGAPMDVLWFTLPSKAGERPAVLGRVVAGQILVRLYRGDYWQCALIIRKGTADEVKREGLPVQEIAARTGLHEGSIRRIVRGLARQLAALKK